LVCLIEQLEQLARLARVLPPREEELQKCRLEHPGAHADRSGDPLRLERLRDRQEGDVANEVQIDAAYEQNDDHADRSEFRAAMAVEVDAQDEAEEADAIEELVDVVIIFGCRMLGRSDAGDLLLVQIPVDDGDLDLGICGHLARLLLVVQLLLDIARHRCVCLSVNCRWREWDEGWQEVTRIHVLHALAATV
ncbi:hypothetical protein PMAYCL1PPCAC_31467, partial [Pristionchus mayeri]